MISPKNVKRFARKKEVENYAFRSFLKGYANPKAFDKKVKDKHEEGFTTRHKPCDFLQPDGNCLLGERRPRSCKEYPYTNKRDRIGSLLSMLENAEVCPVVYEIIERLKQDPDYEAFDEDFVEEFRDIVRKE